MVIHHYTKAATLPLILESGKIRFTRADCLDDPNEMPFKTNHLDPRYYFVSSWTHSQNELSGQWHRYAGESTGVRITLPAMPFEIHSVSVNLSRKSANRPGKKVGLLIKNVELPFSRDKMFGNGYVLVPNGTDIGKDFAGAVTYTDRPEALAGKLVSSDTQTTTVFGGGRPTRFKSNAWSDQSEYRFVLMAVKGPELDYTQASERYENALFDLMDIGIEAGEPMAPPDITYIDLPISKNALDNLTVMLGPRMTVEDREMTKRAVERHAPLAWILESDMKVRQTNWRR